VHAVHEGRKVDALLAINLKDKLMANLLLEILFSANLGAAVEEEIHQRGLAHAHTTVEVQPLGGVAARVGIILIVFVGGLSAEKGA